MAMVPVAPAASLLPVSTTPTTSLSQLVYDKNMKMKSHDSVPLICDQSLG